MIPMTPLFLDGTPVAREALRSVVTRVLDVVVAGDNGPPFPDLTPDQLRDLVGTLDPLPDDGVPVETVLREVESTVLAHGVRTPHPWCAAHLHPPALLTAAAAELAIGATNQSMDSFDQAPAATHVEDHLVRRIAGLVGLPERASGVLTAGGTASNLLGLLLARDRAPGGRVPILASTAVHTSIRQAAAVLGLGRDAVVAVPTDECDRMDVAALDAVVADLASAGSKPLAIVGTAGTTDAGAIDPLDALADRAADWDAWFHVDAALGAGLALSDHLRPLLHGVHRADSVTADLHKLWWQPIGASVLLVGSADSLTDLREPADYLNRADDGDVLNLVDRSLDTSRRFDALKVLVSLRATGRLELAGMVEHLVELARYTASVVEQDDELELLVPPQTVTVLFRCRPRHTPDEELDALNVMVQRHLLGTGQAIVGRTRHRGRVALKLTLVNPLTTPSDIGGLLDLIRKAA